MIQALRTDTDLRATVRQWHRDGLTVGYVPTMGALHEGHLTLVRIALEKADRVITSIYVNPTQFAPTEDLSNYPRTEDDDLKLLDKEGCHAAYLPTNLYGDDHATRVEVDGITADLEGEQRPTHFGGVALVLTKLFNRVRPDVAVFGEKDFQQLAMVRRMVSDLDFPIKIIGAPIARDAHGLALSSRNKYLDADALTTARKLNVILADCARNIALNTLPQLAISDATSKILEAGFDHVDYLAYRDAHTLERVTEETKEARLITVARLNGVRLLDNMAVKPPACSP
jgi:pantoate--beta-alanine ligase